MALPLRRPTIDDDVHERRRRLALVPPPDRRPIDAQLWRLSRLRERARDTLDP